MKIIFIAIYVVAIVLANLTIAVFGPWVSPINAFLLIGLDLAIRDYLHDRWSGSNLWAKMFCLILMSGAISYAINPASGQIAIASIAAFCLSGLVDAWVYHAMSGSRYLIRSNASNTAGAMVDSIVFPTIAFGALMPQIVALQFAAKLIGGGVWAYVIWKSLKTK